MNEVLFKTKAKENFLKKVENKKEKIKKHFADNFVIGMGLNLYHSVASVIKYELIKANDYEEVMDNYLTEEYLTQSFGEIFDNCFYYNEENNNNEGRIYENFKREIWLNIIHKEVAINHEKEVISTIEEKYKKIMNWFEPIFENKELFTTDNPEVFEMYELYYLEDEESVVFHTGGGKPFIFKEGVVFEEFLEQIVDSYKEKKKKKEWIEKQKEILEKKITKNKKEILKKIYHVQKMNEVYHSINLLNEKKKIEGDVEKELERERKQIIKITNALEKITKENKEEKIKNVKFENKEVIITYNNYHIAIFSDQENSYYKKIKEQIQKTELNTAFAKKIEKISGSRHNVEVKIKPTFVNEDIKLKLTFKTIGNIKNFERVIKEENGMYCYKENVMRNMNELYNFIENYVDELAKRLENSRKNAEEFFFSNLTKKEEDIYHQFGFVEMESEEKVYLLKKRKALGTYHVLVVWDREDKDLKDAKCYCIERVQKQLEEYDEMASILLALKAKEFSYIEENANKFNMNIQTKKEIKERYLNAKKLKEAI